jgi:hypothetical protein
MLSILDIQNTVLFSIACCSVVTCGYYNYFVDTYSHAQLALPFQYLAPFITTYTVVDLYFQRSTEVIIHHLLVLGMNSFYIIHGSNITPEYSIVLLYPCYAIEMSSVLYILRYWLPRKSVLYTINSVLFYIVFFKLRIVDYYFQMLDNSRFYEVVLISSGGNSYTVSLLVFSVIGLYLLNVYWFFFMSKLLVKTVCGTKTREQVKI